MKQAKVEIVPETKSGIPVTTRVIAESIEAISDAMKSLKHGPLKRKAIVALIHDHSRVPKGTVEIVLNNLESLAETWLDKPKDKRK